MISPRQVKAARALLDWTQTDLAKASGLHLNAINKLEKGLSEPRSATMERIRNACETAGIRFRGLRGVEMKADTFEMARFEGPDFMRHFVDNELAGLQGPNDEGLYFILDEGFFAEADAAQVARFNKNRIKRGFRERYITKKNDKTYRRADKEFYRWLPDKALGTIAYAILGNRVAFLQWKTQELIIIRNKSLAMTFTNQFEFLWAQAHPFE